MCGCARGSSGGLCGCRSRTSGGLSGGAGERLRGGGRGGAGLWHTSGHTLSLVAKSVQRKKTVGKQEAFSEHRHLLVRDC